MTTLQQLGARSFWKMTWAAPLPVRRKPFICVIQLCPQGRALQCFCRRGSRLREVKALIQGHTARLLMHIFLVSGPRFIPTTVQPVRLKSRILKMKLK